MRMKKGDDLHSDAEQILKLLEENKAALESQSQTHLFIYIATAVSALIFAFVLLNAYIPKEPLFILLGTTGFVVVSLLVVYLIVRATSYRIDTAVLLTHELGLRGWRVSTLGGQSVWNKWRGIYPFLNKGDMDDAISLRVYGEYEGFSFCYFEYDYTIETQEEVKHEDSEGNTYYETEYSYDYYTKSGVIVDVKHDLPYIQTIAGSARADALKFSYIDLNAKMSAYSSDPQRAGVYFTPETQRVFASFYYYFPYANLSIQDDVLFINFETDFMGLSRSIDFDEKLLSYIRGNRTVADIENIMHTLLPLLKSINR